MVLINQIGHFLPPEIFILSVDHIKAHRPFEQNNLFTSFQVFFLGRRMHNSAPDTDLVAIFFQQMARDQFSIILWKLFGSFQGVSSSSVLQVNEKRPFATIVKLDSSHESSKMRSLRASLSPLATQTATYSSSSCFRRSPFCSSSGSFSG